MGRPPAYLFVVRHGYRLDAADKQWHLSSPAPYDPPLTYSGWQQAKNLGVRIASILQERVKEDELAARQNPDQKTKRKRYKVVFHSSPFLRCIQTSIAISAGLAQDSTPFGPIDVVSESRPPTPPSVHGGRPKPIITHIRDMPEKPVKIRKSVLRLDAFLGEWLSPTYFELITPPPESVMMLASAKAELLRREDYVHYPNFSSHNHSNSQGQLWSPVSRSGPGSLPSDGGLDGVGSMSALSGALPRSPSISSQSSQRSESSLASTAKTEVSGYVSPVPHYAVHNNNTIPPGYVAHARDACTSIDYQWDSMRPPLDWGDGGSFPEEWTDMHKRFRAGVQNLVDWYSVTENPTEMVTKTVSRGLRKDSADNAVDDDDDIETEAVVIMVSHGAGCNALIGAITHQPVLMDVAMTSLTMAVRKPDAGQHAEKPRVHQQYDLKLFASTDHIRSPPSTPASSRSPSVAGVMNGARGRHMSFSSTPNNFSWNDNNSSRGSSANAALSGMRKVTQGNTPAASNLLFFGTTASTGGITVGSGVTSFGSTKTSVFGHRPSIGLWSPISAPDEEDEDDDPMVLNFSHEMESSSSVVTPKAVQEAPTSPFFKESGNSSKLSVPGDTNIDPATGISPSSTPKPDTEQLGSGSGGLWGGGPRPPEDADRLRDVTCTKRRWTVTERG
ncbi:hypothetical protein QBC44DRAFT_156804 [Cladorrhinum sp. PSN332]|nr:hypothetical protein QBC44DRAFT_156804 [Cladorrhinum sp. PSN332]